MPSARAPGGSPPGRLDPNLRPEDIPLRARVRVLALWLAALVTCTVILVAHLPLGGQIVVTVGGVAPSDITAPRQVTYVSGILTQQRRDLAAKSVGDVYNPIQARIGRQQLTVANHILDFVATVRSDAYADMPTKAAYLRYISGLDLSPEIVSRIITLPGFAWDRVAAEIQVVLESAMRDEIRENTLSIVRTQVPGMVRLDLSDEDAAIVTAIVQSLLVPNTLFNAELTEQRRQNARDHVEPASTTIARNEVILRAGDIVGPLDIEALEALGMQQSTWTWKDVRATAAFVFLLGLVFLYYLWRQETQLWVGRAESAILVIAVVAFVLVGKATIPAHAVLPYVFPYAALAILLSVLLDLRVALMTMGVFVLIVGWMTNGSLELMLYAFAPAVVGALKLRRGERLASFALMTGYVILVNLAVIGAFRVVAGTWDARGLAELTLAAAGNGLLTLTVTLAGTYLAGSVFGVTTPLQLMEISRPTHPLLRQVLLKAPGTYHHTLIVSNMAERAAEAIGADALLARVGAYYHDVGKTVRPYFFIENRTENLDPHARLDPHTSAQIIIAHVKDGVDLARKYRLPQRVLDFIPEHHGTLLVSYFYHQAIKQAGSSEGVDKAGFRYLGPRPRSRETAIVMLADGAEATVRSKRPASSEELEQVVDEGVQGRLLSGQLDESSLTLSDLEKVKRAFVDVLRGLQHPRITYPPELLPGVAAQQAGELVPAGYPAPEPAQAGSSASGNGGVSGAPSTS